LTKAQAVSALLLSLPQQGNCVENGKLVYSSSRGLQALRRRLCSVLQTPNIHLEVIMKKIALAAILSVAATTAFAGGVAEPVMEPAVVEAGASSSGGIILPLILLVAVAAAVASN
jgi:ABC-type phosphate transport system ATPase subunit